MIVARAVRIFPAVELLWDTEPSEADRDLALVAVDDHQPTAVEDVRGGLRVFFRSAAARDAALDDIRRTLPSVTTVAIDVPDDDWAERSQAAVTPISVGRITVTPPWHSRRDSSAPRSGQPAPAEAIEIIVQPSMGFGTGHHASTRLCLRLLQELLSPGQNVLDVGTGSGVLAIAAHILGAGHVEGVDIDEDALINARENLQLNGLTGVEFRVWDVSDAAGLTGRFDVVLANLTGGLLIRTATGLIGMLRPGGQLIASGFQTHERDDVTAAMVAAGAGPVNAVSEDDWIGAVFGRRPV